MESLKRPLLVNTEALECKQLLQQPCDARMNSGASMRRISEPAGIFCLVNMARPAPGMEEFLITIGKDTWTPFGAVSLRISIMVESIPAGAVVSELMLFTMSFIAGF